MSSVFDDPSCQPVSILERYLVRDQAPREETQHPGNPYALAHDSSPLLKFYLRYRTGPSLGRGEGCFLWLATLRNQLSLLELSSESNPSRTIAGHGNLHTLPLPFLYTFFFQRQGRLMVSRLRAFVLLLLAFALLGAACSKAPGRNDSASTSLSPSGARPTIVFMTDFGTANDAVADRRGCAIPGGGVSLLPLRNGICGGSRPRSRHLTQSDHRQIKKGSVFCSSRQRPDHPGDGSRRPGFRTRDRQSKLDDSVRHFFHFSWPRCLFSRSRAPRRRMGLQSRRPRGSPTRPPHSKNFHHHRQGHRR